MDREDLNRLRVGLIKGWGDGDEAAARRNCPHVEGANAQLTAFDLIDEIDALSHGLPIVQPTFERKRIRRDRIVHFDDIGFTIILQLGKSSDNVPEGGSYHVDFEIIETFGDECGWSPEQRGFPRYWQRDNSPTHPDAVHSLDEAQVEISGFVKWDGCINWEFRDGCWHRCGRDDLARIGVSLTRTHDLCGEMMPEHCDFDPQTVPEGDK